MSPRTNLGARGMVARENRAHAAPPGRGETPRAPGPARWAAAIVLGLLALACFALDDLYRLAKRLLFNELAAWLIASVIFAALIWILTVNGLLGGTNAGH